MTCRASVAGVLRRLACTITGAARSGSWSLPSRVNRPTDARSALRDAIVARMVDAIGIPPDEVFIAPPGAIPKSSSGKIRRSATKQLFVAGALGRGRASAIRQWTVLASGALVWRVKGALGWLGSLIYTAWVVMWVAGRGSDTRGAPCTVPATRERRAA